MHNSESRWTVGQDGRGEEKENGQEDEYETSESCENSIPEYSSFLFAIIIRAFLTHNI